MALVRCPECRGHYSSTARACPGCGYTPPRRTPQVLLLILVLLVLWLVIAGRMQTGGSASAPPPAAAAGPADRARAACRGAIRARLHDPSSADYVHYERWPARQITGGLAPWHVLATVRARNGFGAVVVGEYQCVVRIHTSGYVETESVRRVGG